MLIHFQSRGYSYAKYRVELSATDRAHFTDQQLINLCDNGGRSPDAKSNFGGQVQKIDTDLYEVTVYID